MGNNCCGSRKDDNKPGENLMDECTHIQEITPTGEESSIPDSPVNSGVPIAILSTKNSDLSENTIPMPVKPLKKITQDLTKENNRTGKSKFDGKVYIKIHVDTLEIAYRRLDDFGYSIRPIVELRYENEKVTKFFIINENDELATGTSFNVSYGTGNSIFNTSQNMNTNAKSEKTFIFKQTKIIEVSKEFYYSDLTFWIKNELNGVSNLLTKNNNKIQQNENKPPEVIFGSGRIPVNIIDKTAKERKDFFMNGQIEIRHRNCQLFGILKIHITSQEKPFLSEPQQNILEENSDSVEEEVNFSEYCAVDYRDLNPFTYQSLCGNLNENEIENVESIPRFRNNIVYDPTVLFTQVSELVKMKNSLGLYQILMLFSRLALKDNFTVIDLFFKQFKDKQSEFLADQIIHYSDINNPYVAYYFLSFSLSYYKYQKDHKNIAFRISKVFTDESLFINALAVLDLMISQAKCNNYPVEWKYKIRENIIWCLNIFLELASDSAPIDSKYSNTEIFNQRKKDYTTTYFNCSRIISDRERILILSEMFLYDSEIMNLIYRIFRKGIIALTQYQSKLLDLSQISNHRGIATELKVYLIEDNSTLAWIKLMLNMYQHYPEMQMNLLQLLFNITSLDVVTHSSILLLAAKSLGLQLFKDGYDLFRGIIKGSYKNITLLHLAVLANLSEIINIVPLEQTHYLIMSLICNDIKSLYSTKPEYINRYEDFVKRKKCNIEIQDLITKIGVNITKIPQNVQELLNSLFFHDIIEYLILVSSRTGFNPIEESKENKDVSNSISISIATTTEFNTQPQDFIQQVRKKNWKKFQTEDIAKLIARIVENTAAILINAISIDTGIYEIISSKIVDLQLKNPEDLFVLMDDCIRILENYKIDVVNLTNAVSVLKDLLE